MSKLSELKVRDKTCVHCNGKGYNGLEICTGCFTLEADEFQSRFEEHESKSSDRGYHGELVEDVFDIIIDKLVSHDDVDIKEIRASVISHLDEAYNI